ncbi:TfoX/Sxy family protein [Ramlibacter sp. AN1015]|uniref:TfoX/Sxy family protein n=1 Tax=Ramlibacter sp. AN1015 TaxID=3133428 RepID=UPI0030BECB45
MTRGDAGAPGDETPLRQLPNLGAASARMLACAGLRTAGDLRRVGAVAAYVATRHVGAKVSLNLLWALEGALTARPWREVARLHRTSLLLALDAQLSQHAGRRHAGARPTASS